MDQRRNFYLVFKEAINNIAKHARAHSVWIGLVAEGKNIRLSILDDGIGFDPLKIDSGNGLLNMRKRASLLGGHLEVKTSPGNGTRIELIFTK
jgi:signal transduction histidine kinase